MEVPAGRHRLDYNYVYPAALKDKIKLVHTFYDPNSHDFKYLAQGIFGGNVKGHPIVLTNHQLDLTVVESSFCPMVYPAGN